MCLMRIWRLSVKNLLPAGQAAVVHTAAAPPPGIAQIPAALDDEEMGLLLGYIADRDSLSFFHVTQGELSL